MSAPSLPAASIAALFLGRVTEIEAAGTEQWWDKEWRTGFFKARRPGPEWLGYEGLRGDEQSERRVHGGVDKAVCVYASEHYPFWQSSFPEMDFGAFGENFTTRGWLETEVCVGDVFSLGEATVQISQPRQPCWKLARRWKIKDLSAQVDRTGFTGFYLRVLRHGNVAEGDTLELLERPFAQWSIARCNAVMASAAQAKADARALAQCGALAGSWKDALWRMSE